MTMRLPKIIRRKLVKFARKQLVPHVEPELASVLATLERLEMAAMNMQSLQGADDLAMMYHEQLGGFLKAWQQKAEERIRYKNYTWEGHHGEVKLATKGTNNV